MGLVELLVVILVLALVLYLIQNYLPVDAKLKQLVIIIIIVIAVVWLLRSIGMI